MDKNWWKGAVIYQVYPRSFQDDSGDGIGDLRGITRRLDHVADLGADAVWLSPIFASPHADMGYDISDYTDIDPLFGTLADFDALVARARLLGLKVIVDQVLSHSSDKHPFFVESRSSRDNPRADWYIWADANADGTPPNNWQSLFGGSAWQWDTRRQQYYMHNFLKAQPDFNCRNPQVQDFLLGTMRFWLDRGVDGFRLDTANYYFHDDKLRDQPPAPEPWHSRAMRPYDMQDQIYSKNRPDNLEFIERMRALTDKYEGRAIVGEIGEEIHALNLMAEYTQGDKRLNMAYSFDMLKPEFTAQWFRSRIEGFFDAAPDGWPSWSFSNHDVIRHVSRWADFAVDQDSLARLSIGMLAAFEGTIGIYQGEELGKTDTDLDFHELTDPQGIEFWPMPMGRDGCRSPMVWEADAPNAGFSTARPWLPVKAAQAARAVSVQAGDPTSVLSFYKRVLAFRRGSDVLKTGRSRFVDLPEPVLAFHRVLGNRALTCAFNLSPDEVSLSVSGAARPVGPSQAAELAGGVLALGGNGFVYLECAASDLPALGMAE